MEFSKEQSGNNCWRHKMAIQKMQSMCHRSKIVEIDKFKKKELNKYTELFRNIVSNEIMPVNSSQIGDTTKKKSQNSQNGVSFLVRFTVFPSILNYIQDIYW